jgi:hypothetical protein
MRTYITLWVSLTFQVKILAAFRPPENSRLGKGGSYMIVVEMSCVGTRLSTAT